MEEGEEVGEMQETARMRRRVKNTDSEEQLKDMECSVPDKSWNRGQEPPLALAHVTHTNDIEIFALGQPADELPKKQLSFQRPDSYLEDTTKPRAELTLDCRDL
ncbi:hypothetical protein DUI87_05647 [Hirundo rustica rustica]|uniref:Uncharacterized protein n=1 Tax=Hirundo rustica rustica TaxID=333673 RepID=A0A3M0KWK5_HIRRU|nr:hypothetical protein DUI87_05647 [Hirundo rustica rustica]